MSVGKIRITNTIEVIKTVSGQDRVYPFAVLSEDVEVDSIENKNLVLAASEADTELSGVCAIWLNCASDFVVKVGGAGATAVTTKMFSYKGASVSLFFTNPDSENEIEISYLSYIVA